MATTCSIRESPLPPAPSAEDVFSPLEWETLLAIADTIIPVIGSISTATTDSLALEDAELAQAGSSLQFGSSTPESADIALRYLEERPSTVPGFKESVARFIGLYIPSENKKKLSMILSGLNMRPISLLLTGSPTPFQHQPYATRDAILRGWGNSYLAPLRGLYRSLVSLCNRSWLTTSPTLPKILGLPRVPIHGTPADGYPHIFLQFPPGNDPEIIETDVVVVGSGCGAGITAKNLAEAGHRVLVVEKSYYFPPSHFPMDPTQASVNLFASGGAEVSNDGCISVISGSTWGGGGTINWSASLQTQARVREEWANGGLPFFTSMAFQSSLDRVCDRMGVSTENIKHNHGNRMIMEGARKLGYSVKAVPQNTGNKKHYCGYCAYGCHTATKQGPAVSTLVDASAAGATFIEGFNVNKVIFDDQPNGKHQKVAAGVEGIWTSRDSNGGTSGEPLVKRKVIVKAKKVVVSCGSLQSPLLLLRSGINNSNIGRNLYLHPVIFVSARFDNDINPWEGGILTSVVTEFENLDGAFHGTKIEALAMLPGLFLPMFPRQSGLDIKLFASNLRRTNGFISLTRDLVPGRLYPDPVDGRCRIVYTPSATDRKHMLEGALAAAKIAYVSGAREIRTTCRAVPPFVRSDSDSGNEGDGVNNAAFTTWLNKFRVGTPLEPSVTSFASAHQMGTCRMSQSPRAGVVDPTGQVWGTEGLYVADASVFPSASGVNPMITNMAISDWTSRNLAERMTREKKTGGTARL